MNQLGYYGKTPHRGDFVRFNLPQPFIKVWDDWLQQVMISGETQAQTWPELYAQAPAYRFILSSGIAGNTPWMGILKASQDKVGRRFPFCLAMSLNEQALPCVSATERSLWFDEAEALLQRVMASDYDFDELQGELADMADRHAQGRSTTGKQVQTNKPSADAVTISVMSANALGSSQVLPVLLDTVLRQTLGEFSLWMASGTLDATIISAGLPINDAGLALFDLSWESASTAVVDLDMLAERSGQDKTVTTSIAAGIAASAAGHDESPLPTAQDPAPEATVAEASVIPASSSQQPEDLQSSAVTEQAPSADDWAALDDFDDTPQASDKVLIPEVETLELDEDDLPEAPWEQ